MILEKVGKWIIDLGTHMLDDHVPSENLRSFLTSGLDRATEHIKDNPSSIPAESVVEIILARELIERINMQLTSPINGLQAHPSEKLNLDQITAWIERLPKNRIVTSDWLILGSGDVLLWLNDHQPPHLQGFFHENMERTLRHIEVKRKAALQMRTPSTTNVTWMERHAVAIVFCRYTRDTGDVRYLNAALKLNDWAYPSHRKLSITSRLIRYLLALAEAEAAIREIAN